MYTGAQASREEIASLASSLRDAPSIHVQFVGSCEVLCRRRSRVQDAQVSQGSRRDERAERRGDLLEPLRMRQCRAVPRDVSKGRLSGSQACCSLRAASSAASRWTLHHAVGRVYARSPAQIARADETYHLSYHFCGARAVSMHTARARAVGFEKEGKRAPLFFYVPLPEE